MTAKHTPGKSNKWLVCGYEKDGTATWRIVSQFSSHFLDEDGFMLATAVAVPVELAIAAPDLLAACKYYADALRRWRSTDPANSIYTTEYMELVDAVNLDALIARAEGRSTPQAGGAA